MLFKKFNRCPTEYWKHLIRSQSQFFSPSEKPDFYKKKFLQFLRTYNNILVLTGAGVSTESGIPDYRSEGVGLLGKKTYKPTDHVTFIKSKEARIRYWARSYVGWPIFSSKQPNKTHQMISYYQGIPNKISAIITQNVDGLHHKAGSINITELHGNLYWVQCLECKQATSRFDFQHVLEALNPSLDMTSNLVRPDGDVEIDEEIYKVFKIPDCENCGGILKPTVVFFGDNVLPKVVKKVQTLVESCDAMLIMGTSLSTLSSYRIVNQAYDLCKYICLVNIGPTKCDKMADLLLNTNCSSVFTPEVII